MIGCAALGGCFVACVWGAAGRGDGMLAGLLTRRRGRRSWTRRTPPWRPVPRRPAAGAAAFTRCGITNTSFLPRWFGRWRRGTAVARDFALRRRGGQFYGVVAELLRQASRPGRAACALRQDNALGLAPGARVLKHWFEGAQNRAVTLCPALLGPERQPGHAVAAPRRRRHDGSTRCSPPSGRAGPGHRDFAFQERNAPARRGRQQAAWDAARFQRRRHRSNGRFGNWVVSIAAAPPASPPGNAGRFVGEAA